MTATRRTSERLADLREWVAAVARGDADPHDVTCDDVVFLLRLLDGLGDGRGKGRRASPSAALGEYRTTARQLDETARIFRDERDAAVARLQTTKAKEDES